MRAFLKLVVKTYLFTCLFFCLFFYGVALLNSVRFDKIIGSLINLITSKRGLLLFHSLFFVFLIIALIAKYIFKIYKKDGFKKAFINLGLKVVLPILILIYGVKFLIYYNNSENFNYDWNYEIENKSEISQKKFLDDNKFRGMNVYGIGRRKNDSVLINQLVKNNIEWVAVIPYFYQENENTSLINTPDSVGIWSKRDSLLMDGIYKLHQKEVFVLLKPHLWMSSGWRSNINFTITNDWDEWFTNYRKNILHFAKMAQETNSEMFCVGTELRSSLQAKPEEWISLINDIKTIYNGKLTYAANWDDSFEFTEFWDLLDYVGVQAYYPLTKNKNPNLDEIKNGWNKPINKLKDISKGLNKQILFTEVGYRPDVYATSKPWAWGSFFERLYKKKSDKTQLLAYQAMYEKLWNEPWFAGTFPWEWNSGDFPIYEKPSQNMIAIWYAK